MGRWDLNQDIRTMSPERRRKHHNLTSEGNSMDILALWTKPKKSVDYNRTYFNKVIHSNPSFHHSSLQHSSTHWLNRLLPRVDEVLGPMPYWRDTTLRKTLWRDITLMKTVSSFNGPLARARRQFMSNYKAVWKGVMWGLNNQETEFIDH